MSHALGDPKHVPSKFMSAYLADIAYILKKIICSISMKLKCRCLESP